MRELKTEHHLVADIHGAIDAVMRRDPAVLRMLNYRSYKDALKDLRAMIQDGYMVIPNKGCDNQAYDGNCLGHQIWSEPSLGVSVQEAAEALINVLSPPPEFMK